MTEDAIDRIVEEWNRERPELDGSSTHVLQRITRLYLLQSASFAEVFGRYGLTFGEYEVLAALVRSGPPHRMRPSELGGAVVLSSGAMTHRIDRVEAAGMVERLPDPDDRRGTLVALREKGRQVVDEAVRAHLANEERLLAALSAEERRQLTALLRKLLVSEPFVALDPNRPATTNSRVVDQAAPARRPRRR
ncbi:MAG TPA: MarR family transcriptional regulator [Candidatus Dormibacteraeota bacterium]|jgi:DNA-binding MarR family transcriptional regulator